MAGEEPPEPGVQIIDDTLIDEDGRRWEFDFGVGWRTDVAALVSETGPLRIFAGDYADAREISLSALGGLGGDLEGGVYRSGADSVVYIAQ